MTTIQDHRAERASSGLPAGYRTTERPAGSQERANERVDAKVGMTVPAETIDRIRLAYRLAKAAETSRIRIDLGLYALARVYASEWTPDAEKPTRAKAAAQAKRVVDTIRKGGVPREEDRLMYTAVAEMVLAAEPSRVAFDAEGKKHHRNAEQTVRQLPSWQRIGHVKGFSAWGLAAIIGEAGDIGQYSGCRKLFKRLGLAPDECYPTGEKKTGRKIPRMARGRVMGIIAEPLLRAQWRGAKEVGDDDGDASHEAVESHCGNDRVPVVVPAHAIGPYGKVYGDAKARHLAAGKSKGHADKAARRAMVKALLHDVHAAWHGEELMYAKTE